MLTDAESQEGCVWEEVLLSDDLTDSGEELEGIDVVIEAPEEVDHA